MDSSKFNLWRACFAFCHIDGHVSVEEKQWIDNKLNSLKFTDDQRATLQSDLQSPPQILALLPSITKPSDRAFLVDQMRVLGFLDKDFSEVERKKMELVRQEVLAKINIKMIEADLAQVEQRYKREARENRFPSSGVFAKFLKFIDGAS